MANVIKFGTGLKSLSELTTDDSKAIVDMYNSIKNDVKYEIMKIDTKINPNESDKLKKLQLKDLLRSLDKNLKELEEQQANMITSSMNNVSQAVVQSNFDWLSSLDLKFKASMAHIPQDVITNIVSGKLYGNDWKFSQSIWGIYNNSKGTLSNIVAKGIAENKSTYEIAKDLEKYVNPNLSKPSRVIKYPIYEKNSDGTFKKDSNGKRIPIPGKYEKFYFGKVDYNAQRLARTMVAHAYQQSIIETCKQNPYVEKILWKSALVERTCALCESRNGQIYDLNKVPLDHPNGLCTFEAVLTKNLDEISKELSDWVSGEDNEKLDDYMTYISGQDFHKEFNDLQNKWLKDKGYNSPYNIPEFTTWSHSLTSEEKKELFDMLNLHSELHPFQKMEIWYNENISKTKYSFELVAEKSAKKTESKVFNELQNQILSPLGFSPNNMPKNGKQFAEFVFNEYTNLSNEEYNANWDFWNNLKSKAGIKELFWDGNEEEIVKKLKKYYNNNLKMPDDKKSKLSPGVQGKLTKESKAILNNAYSKQRMKAGIWFNGAYDADLAFRSTISDLWQNVYTESQKEALYLYTAGSGFMNRPLRGYDGSWYNFKGVGNVSLNNENSKGEFYINQMTEAISKSSYQKDYWFNRGIETTSGLASFLNVKEDWLNKATDKELQTLIGKVVTDEGFTSCGTSKGSGFSGHKMNVFCPAGTHMIYAEPWSHYGGEKYNYNDSNNNIGYNFWDGKTKQSYFGHEDETIIQRGTSYAITKIKRNSDGIIEFECAVVGQKY